MKKNPNLKVLGAVLIVAAITPIFFAKQLQNQKIARGEDIKERYDDKLKLLSTKFQDNRIRGPAAVPKTLPAPPTLQKEHKASDDKVQDAVRHFTENFEKINKSWAIYRVQMYRKTGLTDQEIGTIDHINDEYVKVLEEIQTESSQENSSATRLEALSRMQDEIIEKQNHEMRRYLGEIRYDYVTGARAAFNKHFQEQTNSKAETLAW